MNSSNSNSAVVSVAPLPFKYQFVAGAIAGISEICIMYPLDVVKTRFQLQVNSNAAASSSHLAYKSILDCFQKIIKNEGFGRLYHGLMAPVLIEAPKRAIKFAANEQYTEYYKRLFGMKTITQPLSILTGISAGVTEAFVVVSMDMVKIRMQDPQNAGLYRNTFDAMVKIFRQEGPLAFFTGLEATILRHAMWNGGYFGVIYGVREALPKANSHEGNLFRNFIAGTIGGTFGTILNTPFDVVKTRVQSFQKVKKYNWAFPALYTIVKEEGYPILQSFLIFRFSALYKGFVPKVLRLGPGGGILLVVFDQVSSLMRKYFNL